MWDHLATHVRGGSKGGPRSRRRQMGSVWIDIPTSEVDPDEWIHLSRLEIDSDSRIGTKLIFDKIALNISIPERAFDISKVENVFVSEEPGTVGAVFLKRYDFSIPINNNIFKNFDFCQSLEKLHKNNIISLLAQNDNKTAKIFIDFFLTPDFLSLNDLSRRLAKKHKSMQNHLRNFLIFLFPQNITSSIDENKIKQLFMDSLKGNAFYTQFKHLNLPNSPYKIDDELAVKLFPYQVKNVNWMISRENNFNKHREFSFEFFKINNNDDTELYFNNFTGKLTDSTTDIKAILPRGGILADEMGLGKTIEVLALVVLNPFKFTYKPKKINLNQCNKCQKVVSKKVFEVYKNLVVKKMPGNLICSSCLKKADIYKSRATLIVCPASLLEQWINEINSKVTTEITYAIYEGLRRKYIHPISLVDYDIIITTYNVLLSEFYHSDIFKGEEEKELRRKRKYESKPSPFSFVEFWRVVFDESQVAESKAAKMSQMCCNIKSVNRWCVTGTPIHRSLDDIEGLFSLINYTPFNEKKTFQELFYHDLSIGKFDSLVMVLQDVMHRTEKVEAETEANIPNVTEKTIFIELDPVELHYYLDFTQRNSLKSVKWNKYLKKNKPDQKINSKAHKNLMFQFSTLRRLCSDPFHLLPKKARSLEVESIYNMQEAIEKLIERKKLDCEEISRSLFMYRNGLAGLAMLKSNKIRACEIYRETIEIYNRNRQYFNIDSLQKIHILRNYLSLASNPDASLKKLLAEAMSKYLEASMTDMVSSKKPLNKIVNDISSLEADDSLFTTFKTTIEGYLDYAFTITNKISNMIKKEGLYNSPFSKHFKLVDLERYVSGVLRRNKNLLTESIDLISDLEVTNRKEVLKAARLCCIGPGNLPKTIMENGKHKFNQNCPFCKIDSKLHDLELSLFDHITKSPEPGLVAGFRGNTDVDVILKAIYPAADSALTECPLRLWLMYVKKCFTALRSHFTNVRTWFTAQDEIETCCRRLTLSDIKKPIEMDKDQLVLSTEIEHQEQSEILKKQLDVEISQLRYFTNLSQSFSAKTSFNTELCPVCYEELGTQWVVLACSHFICNLCYKKSYKITENVKFDCPMCRFRSPNDEVYYINTERPDDNDNPKTIEFPTKVTKIVETIEEIMSYSRGEKIIVFSNWDSVLELCKICLIQNGLSLSYAVSVNQLTSELQKFNQDSNNRILLMSLRLGSKGITITSANHVIFADVCLNRQDELQAIGRCHRIGQIRPIKVYYFVTKTTIEEKIYNNREVTENLFPTKARKTFTSNQAKEFLKFNEEKQIESNTDS